MHARAFDFQVIQVARTNKRLLQGNCGPLLRIQPNIQISPQGDPLRVKIGPGSVGVRWSARNRSLPRKAHGLRGI